MLSEIGKILQRIEDLKFADFGDAKGFSELYADKGK
jgi:hypothetical protein